MANKNLTGQTIAASYDQILISADENGVTGQTTSATQIICGTGTAGAGNTGTTPLYLSRDFVGIGTATPHDMLDIESPAGNNASIRLTSPANYDSSIHFGDAGGDGVPEWYLGTDGNEANRFVLSESDGSDDASTTTDALATNVRLCVKEGGNVGIGATDPSSRLQVEASSGVADIAITSGNSSGDYSILRMGDSGNEANYQITVDHNANLMQFVVGGSARQTILSNGTIGIGEASPNTLLHVTGTGNSNTNQLSQIDRSEVKFQYRADEEGSMYFGGLGSNKGYIQGADDDGSHAYDICINPYGGNVGIGVAAPSEKLHIANNESIFWGGTTEYSRIVSYVGEWDNSASTTHSVTIGYDAQDWHVVAFEALVVLRNASHNSGYTYSIRGSFVNGGTLAAATIWSQGSSNPPSADPVFSDDGSNIILTMTGPQGVSSHNTGYTIQLREVRTS